MFLNILNPKIKMVEKIDALPGRNTAIVNNLYHAVQHHSLHAPFPQGYKTILLGMGCFWGAERLFWQMPGVYVTAVGYAGGFTPNPTYEEVCSGLTGHTEVVLVVYDPKQLSLKKILSVFFEEHDPTQGMQQGNDIGTNYRSCIYVNHEDDYQLAQKMRDDYEKALLAYGKGSITTEIVKDIPFYYAEEVHQQYLHKVPNGYCGLKGVGVSCPVPR